MEVIRRDLLPEMHRLWCRNSFGLRASGFEHANGSSRWHEARRSEFFIFAAIRFQRYVFDAP